MPDVTLVYLPYGPLERPSLALGMFKTSLEEAGLTVDVRYDSFLFAERIGPRVYTDLSWVREEMMAEWTFAGAAFPDFAPPHDEYLDRVAASLAAEGDAEAASWRERLWGIRRAAEAFIDEVAHAIVEDGPRIVGCSSTFNQHCAMLALTRRIKQLDPTIVTVAGGGNCDGEMGRGTAEQFRWLDHVVCGEADEVFVRLCQSIVRGEWAAPAARPSSTAGRPGALPIVGDRAAASPPGALVGVLSRTESGVVGEGRATFTDLNDCAVPDFGPYFEALDESALRDAITPGLLIETSRGCWWGERHHCTFCGLNGGGMTYRCKTPARALDEFHALTQNYGIHRFLVVDNILDKGYYQSVLPALAARSDRLTLLYEIKSNVTYEQLRSLRDAGVTWIQPGIESLHDEALKLMKKGVSAWVNTLLLRGARELGQNVAWNILCGFPGEADAWYHEMMSWMPLIEHLQPPKDVRPIRFDRFSPYQMQPEEYGLKLHPTWPFAYIYPVSTEAAAQLVYFFEEEGRAGTARRDGTDWSGRDALRDHVVRWHARFMSDDPPILVADEGGEHTTLLDTRTLAPERHIRLEGLAHRVHRACSRCPPEEKVVALVAADGGPEATTAEVHEALETLRERKLLLRFGARYMSLAVPTTAPPIPMRMEDGYPGGWVMRDRLERSLFVRPLRKRVARQALG